MKRVINGKAYNTDTAEAVAESDGTFYKDSRHKGPEWRYHVRLYRTPKGAWFTVEEEWAEGDRDVRTHRTHFEALKGLDAAIAWVRENNCTVHSEDYFPKIEPRLLHGGNRQ